ncbi:MAG: two-component system, OmpR family, alkaline phosphatase synthesis response regulator PhoP [Dehalococcoidales bacterium]|nr:two-component system, OmpR family, alkaline phosphatase synthesis response regulator PhoP [Dehalococcoidales bacterium]
MPKVILVVEDDPSSMKLVIDILQVSGYETIEATDGEQGVRLAKDNKPDLILMDIMMPRMDGYTACTVIKSDQETRNIPIVFLTAVDYALNKRLGNMVGGVGYITKPISLPALQKVLSQFLPTS